LKLLPRILAEEDELDRAGTESESLPEPTAQPEVRRVPLRWVAVVALAAVLPRLAYLFLFSDPENAGDPFTDAYHHWQISYLTKEIGLSHGPRLWDMRGWEYFWGLLHPLLMNVLFFATGSTDIVLARLLSLAFGSMAVVLIFLLCHRYWGLSVAIAAGAFAAFSPAAIFNDVAGMAEPTAIALILLGIWLTPGRGFWGGVAWALAAMARVEAWFFGAGLVVAWIAGARRPSQSRAPLVIGWALGMGLYAKFLSDQTGNPIYPLYWNLQFVGLGAGGTGATAAASPGLLWIPVGAVLLGSVVGLAWALWRQPPSYLFLTFGFGYSALSLATYFRYATEWKERRFEFPLDFAAILVAVLLLKWLSRDQSRLRPLGWSAAAAGILAAQALWLPIQAAYASTEPLFRYEVGLGRSIGEVYNRPEYRGGVLNMPGDEPTLLYVMVRDEGFPGDRVTSQFYDPFYYLPAGYRYAEHADVVGPLLQCWLSKTQTRLILISPLGPLSQSVPEYQAYIADHPQWFADTGAQLAGGWTLIAVNVPAPTGAACTQAAQAAPH
jgi:hypothetical protein